jgi:hypothetical protein
MIAIASYNLGKVKGFEICRKTIKDILEFEVNEIIKKMVNNESNTSENDNKEL